MPDFGRLQILYTSKYDINLTFLYNAAVSFYSLPDRIMALKTRSVRDMLVFLSLLLFSVSLIFIFFCAEVELNYE